LAAVVRLKVASADTVSKRAAALYFDNMTSLLTTSKNKKNNLKRAPHAYLIHAYLMHAPAVDDSGTVNLATARQHYWLTDWITVSDAHMPAA
jgi:hypothetical protein